MLIYNAALISNTTPTLDLLKLNVSNYEQLIARLFSLFQNIVNEYDSSILIATHDNNVSKISNKILNLSKGKIK